MTDTPVDIRRDESNADYHADMDCLSHSMLESFIDSPQRFEGEYITGEIEREETAAMRRGSLVHFIVLERWDDGGYDPYRLLSPSTRTTKAWKQQSAKAIEDGLIPILDKEWAEAESISRSVMAHPLASSILAACDPSYREVSVRWTDDGVDKRARLDVFADDAEIDMKRTVIDETTGDTWAHCFQYKGPVIVDLKTAADPCEREFKRSVWKYGYDRQAAWYQDAVRVGWGYESPMFLFIVVGSKAPHDIYVYELPPDKLAEARGMNAEAVKMLTECRKSGVWQRDNEQEILTLD